MPEPPGALPATPAGPRLRAALADAGWDDLAAGAEPFGPTFALLLVVGGGVVAEQHAPGHGPAQTARSWSMAKSVLHAAVGLAVGDGRIALDAPLAAPGWAADDPRSAITVEHALRMVDGLDWVEDYDEGASRSDVQEMLFGAGRDDVAAYAAGRPLAHPPGEAFCYSSGTSNLLAQHLARAVGGPDATAALLHDRLFDPLGATSARPRFDRAGTWIASSYLFATARDFARFGLLYLHDGTWGGRRILPEGWVEHARTPTPASGVERYGAHWWRRDDGWGTFQAQGYATQRIVVCPALDTVVVRLGETPPGHGEAVDAVLGGVLGAVAAHGAP